VQEVLELYPSVDAKRQAHEVQRRVITRAIEDVIAESAAAIAAARVQSAEDVRLAGATLIRFSPATAEAEQGLKTFLFDKVYRHEAVMAPVRRSEQVVEDLFARYMETRDLPGVWGLAARAA